MNCDIIFQKILNNGHKIEFYNDIKNIINECNHKEHLKEFHYYLMFKSYPNDLIQGYKSCDYLINNFNTPCASYNLIFYTSPLKIKWKKEIKIKNEIENFVPSSSCMLKYENNYYCIQRCVNYIIDKENGSYIFRGNFKTIKTENIMLTLDNNLNIINENIIKYDKPPFKNNIEGYEDVRFFNDINNFIATSLQHHNRGYPTIISGNIENPKENPKFSNIKNWCINYCCEKNWIPIPKFSCPNYQKENVCIYKIHPLELVNIDTGFIHKQNNLKPLIKNQELTHRLRGSSIIIEWNNGFLMIVHQVGMKHNGKRIYYHRWLWIDKNWKYFKLSPTFNFEKEDIEYTLSICNYDNDKTSGFATKGCNVLINYSIYDNNSNIICVDNNVIKELLEI